MKKSEKATAERPPEVGIPEAVVQPLPTHVWVTPTNPVPGQADQFLPIATAYKVTTRKTTWKPKSKEDQNAITRYGTSAEAKGATVQEADCGCH